MIKNAATTKAASNTSPGLLLLFYITIGTLPSESTEELISESTAGILKFLAPSQTNWQEIRPNTARISDEAEKSEIDSKAKEAKRTLGEMLLSSLQMSNLVILSGSGTSLGYVGGPSMKDLWDYAINDESEWPKDKVMRIMKKVNFVEENEGKNIEAFLSQCEAYLQVKEDKKVGDFVKYCKRVILDKCSAFLIDEKVDEKLEGHCMCHRLSPPFLRVSFSIHMRVECFTKANSQRSHERSIQSKIFKNIRQQIVGFLGEYGTPS